MKFLRDFFGFLQKYIFSTEKSSSKRKRKEKCVYVLKSDSNSSYSEMNALTLSVFVVYADDMLSIPSASLFSPVYFGLQRSGLKSQESLWPSVTKLFLPSFARAWLGRICQVVSMFPFRAEEGIWAVASIEKALALSSPVPSQLRGLFTNVFRLAVLDPCALLAPLSP